MGVPVVTLPRDQPVSRQTQGFLTAIGRPEWIAADVESYIRLATELARQPAALTEMRATQRREIAGSALCDQMCFGHRFGEALRTMWRTHVATSSTAMR